MKRLIDEALTFDDVSLVPQKSNFLPKDVDLKTKFTKKISLNIPLASAAMDTVTESVMAVALARLGGIGVIHKNLSIERQAEEILKVKRSENGVIGEPVTLRPETSLNEALTEMAKYHISGIPITNKKNKLLGILTNRDILFETDLNRQIGDLMTKKKLITALVGTTLDQAREIFKKHKIEKLPIVDDKFYLKGMITIKDLRKIMDFPWATKDSKGRLLVAAAVGSDNNLDRVKALVDVGVDVIVVDSAHGHSQNVIKKIEKIKEKYSKIQVVGGNIVTGEGARDLIKAGADAVKVGMGPGSICTTRVIAGIGVPQVSAIMNCVEYAAKHDVPVIADGGIKYSGDIVKAIAAGANSVMIGSLFAGTDESPGELIHYEGRLYKKYRGMGSVEAMKKGSSDRYFQEGQQKLVPEGIEGQVPYRGKLADIVFQLIGGLRAGMGYTGNKKIDDLRTKTKFVKVTGSGLSESHPHDVMITKDAPNYTR